MILFQTCVLKQNTNYLFVDIKDIKVGLYDFMHIYHKNYTQIYPLKIPEQENMVEPELNIEHFSSINTFLPELCDFLIIFTVFSSCPSTSISKKIIPMYSSC